MQRALSPSLQLLIACCRWPADPAVVRRLADEADGASLAALARRHRVQGLVHRGLAQAGIPDPDLARDARRIAANNLRQSVEAVRLLRAMTAADVPALLIKGVALGVLAYRDGGVKMGWDIDLLVAPDRLDAAVRVMAETGYGNVVPGPGAVSLSAWHRFAKDSIWRHPAGGVHVELHTRLLENPTLLAGVTARSPSRDVALGGGLSVPTLQAEELFAYLCLHGTASGWRRLKWLADLAALLAQGDAAATERLYVAAQALGAGRAAGAALLLCRRFFDTPLTPALAAALHADRAVRLLAWSGARMLMDERGYDDPAERIWGTLPIHLAQFLVQPGWRARWREARRRLTPDPRVGGSALLYPLRVLHRRWREARSARG